MRCGFSVTSMARSIDRLTTPNDGKDMEQITLLVRVQICFKYFGRHVGSFYKIKHVYHSVSNPIFFYPQEPYILKKDLYKEHL